LNTSSISQSEADALNKKLANKDNETRVFIKSHLINLPSLISNIKVKNLHFIFYIMGDMTIEVQRWIQLDKLLRDHQVSFLCASTAQLKQVNLFTNNKVAVLCQYPVESELKKTNNNDSIQLVYAGRITPQKNINKLLKVFIKASKIKKGMNLSIAGEFHSRTYPFYGSGEDNKDYKEEFFKLVKSSNGLITYHGNLCQNDLAELFSESSHLINISTYMDEDFSIVAAQAMSCGLKIITTQWGGLKDHNPPKSRYTIPIFLSDNNLYQPDLGELFKALILTTPQTQELSDDVISYFKSKYSINTISQRLSSILNTNGQKYCGQSELFFEYSRKYNKPRFTNKVIGCPFLVASENEKEQVRSLIDRIYTSYT